MSKKRRKFVTDSDNSGDDDRPEKSSKNNDSSDSLSESSEEEEWTLNTESRKTQPKKLSKKDEKKVAESMESSDPDEGELTESERESMSDDSDDAEFNDGLDENCVGDDEDRNKLACMTEAERERVLFERMEKRESMKTRQEIQRKLKLQKKKEEAAKVEADRKKNEQENKVVRTQRMRKQGADDKGKGKAIDELKAKREAHKARLKSNEGRRSPEPKMLLKTKDVYTDDEDDDEKSLSESSSDPESGEESSGESSPEIVRYITNNVQLSKIKLSRFKLEKWVHLPLFKNTVCGCFIRIGIGDKMGKKIYRVAEIFDVVVTPKTYSLGNVKTNKGLKVRHGRAENMYRLEFVSNQDFTDSEFSKWKGTMDQNNLKLPSIKFVDTKHKLIQEALNHEFTEEEISSIVKEKQKFRKNPLNYAAEKSDILSRKQFAESLGEFAEVEKLKADLEDLETDADKVSKMRNKGLSAVSYINDKNRLRTSDQIEEALRKDYAAEKLAAPDPFRRRKSCIAVVTPKYQATEDSSKYQSDILKKLADEREQKDLQEKQLHSTKSGAVKENQFLDPFELHNDCDIDIDIGPVDSGPAISPPPDTSVGRRGYNLSDFKKKVGLM